MLIDASLLRRAKLENIERLARSLGVDVPKRRRDSVYASQLVGAIASRIRRDAMMDELKKLTTLGSSLVGGSTRSARTSRTRYRSN
jgi:hypothetical protein